MFVRASRAVIAAFAICFVPLLLTLQVDAFVALTFSGLVICLSVLVAAAIAAISVVTRRDTQIVVAVGIGLPYAVLAVRSIATHAPYRLAASVFFAVLACVATVAGVVVANRWAGRPDPVLYRL